MVVGSVDDWDVEDVEADDDHTVEAPGALRSGHGDVGEDVEVDAYAGRAADFYTAEDGFCCCYGWRHALFGIRQLC